MLHIGGIVLGVDDLDRAATFWSNALAYQPQPGQSAEGWIVLEPAYGTGTPLALDVSETPVDEHPRVHLDLFARDADDQAAEVERLLALGAQQVDWDMYPEDPDFVVLADTEGNRFCIVDSSRL